MVRQSVSVFDIAGSGHDRPLIEPHRGRRPPRRARRAVFGELPASARIGLHGSFATTGHGHGTDLALVAGCSASPPTTSASPRRSLARGVGHGGRVRDEDLGEAHPNTARFQLTQRDGREMRVVGSSLGGGDVVVSADRRLRRGDHRRPAGSVVEHQDRPGEIAAVTAVLAAEREHRLDARRTRTARRRGRSMSSRPTHLRRRGRGPVAATTACSRCGACQRSRSDGDGRLAALRAPWQARRAALHVDLAQRQAAVQPISLSALQPRDSGPPLTRSPARSAGHACHSAI